MRFPVSKAASNKIQVIAPGGLTAVRAGHVGGMSRLSFDAPRDLTDHKRIWRGTNSNTGSGEQRISRFRCIIIHLNYAVL